MSFEKVESAVIAEAGADAEKILAVARRECDELLARVREDNVKALEESIHQEEAATARETARQLGVARHDGRLEVLDAKNLVIDDIFNRVTEKLRSMDMKEYRDLLEGWLQTLSSEIGGVIRVSSKDTRLFDDAIVKRINGSRSRGGTFTAVEPDSRISGGFIIQGDTYTVDFTLDRILKELRESIAGDLAKELFES